MADAPVLLVGDIDRGGVFAALRGTLSLLDPDDRARVGGLIVNRFRGDATVLTPGIAELSARAGVPVLGVVPYLDARLVPSEDSLDLDDPARGGGRAADRRRVRGLPDARRRRARPGSRRIRRALDTRPRIVAGRHDL